MLLSEFTGLSVHVYNHYSPDPSTSWQALIMVPMLSQHTSGFSRICDYFVKLTRGLKYNLDRP